MKLQLALDRLSKEDCVRLISETRESVDWIEIGTGTIKEHGIAFVEATKREWPEKTIVADMKICDAGRHEAELAFRAGADVVTVMGFANLMTIWEVISVARECGKDVMVDLLEITDPDRVAEIAETGADLFCLHVGKDRQGTEEASLNEQYPLVSGLKDARIAVAGGIGPESVPALIEMGVDVAIVGSAITKSDDPGKAAAELAALLQ
ncbi:3-hexulose-6-phosphate synthase [Kroppenstedtia sanguinis]|uniref:3-hexulose-6-phosphate synthase n=1 Tax=Kroppenstedtia sanguinis TaxID=1380684 RepID=A0ABW4CCS8_9BACL